MGEASWQLAPRGEEEGLGEDVGDEFAVDVGEAEVAALVAEGEAFVVEAELVEDGGVEVVDVDTVFGDIEPEVVGFAVADAGFDAAAGHPHGEGVFVVVAADADFFAAAVLALFDGGAAEFGAPDDEGFIEEAAEFEVADEGGHALVDVFGFGGEAFVEAAVVVPVGVVELDHADAALDEAAGEEAVVGEGGFAGGGAVHVEGGLGFFGDVHQIGDAGLHAVGHFVLADAGGDFGVAQGAEALFVEGFDGVEDVAAIAAGVAFGIAEEEDGVAFGAELDALVDAGEEAGGPEGGAGATGGAGEHDDVGGEVAVFTAEAVGDPGPHGGAAALAEAAVEEHLGGGVIDLVGVEGFDDAEVVGDGGEVGQQFGHPGAALAVLFEFEGGALEGGFGADEGEAFAFEEFGGAGLAAAFDELGFVVEEIELRGGADHVEVDDVLGLGGEVGVAGEGDVGRGGGGEVAGEEGAEGGGAEGEAAGLEEGAAGENVER